DDGNIVLWDSMQRTDEEVAECRNQSVLTGTPSHQPKVLLVKHRIILFIEKKDERCQELLKRREREIPSFREFDEVLNHFIIEIQVISHQYIFFEVINQHDA